MTNKEYIEKNNISFSEAMKMYDNEKYPCINDWLNQERIEHKFKIGDKLNSISEIALELNFSKTTIRYAIANLLTTKILQKRNNNYFINRLDFNTQNVEKLTLVEKTVNDIKKYVEKNFKIGDKIPNTEILSNKFYVSLKTVNDAIKLLNKSGFLFSKPLDKNGLL